MTQEGPAVCKGREAAVEREPPGLVQRHQPGEEEAPEQLAQYPHR